jgi:leucyl/phenylalanyl-tRNA--protein transferase
MIPWLEPGDPFPPIESAMRDPNGLLAAGGDLSPVRLLDAYARGIFPWFNEDEPPLWWSPDPRMVVFSAERHVTRSLRRVIGSGRFQVTMDTAFVEVMAGCASPRLDQEGTWITPQIVDAYTRLNRLGYAHSIETWADGELVGGLYGVAVGRMFFGESMFARRSDASKVAFATMLAQFERWGMPLVDCQVPTSHLASLGGREIPRAEFLRHLRALIRQPAIASPWRLDGAPPHEATSKIEG